MRLISSVVHLSVVLSDIQNPGLVEPSKCEACKYFTIELKGKCHMMSHMMNMMNMNHR